MLQVADLVERSADEDEAVILAIAVLLRPLFLDRSDERAVGKAVADRVGFGIRRAAELVEPSTTTDDLTPKFWDVLFKQILADLGESVVLSSVRGWWTAEDCAIYLSFVLERQVTAQDWKDYADGTYSTPEPFSDGDGNLLWDAEQVVDWKSREGEHFAERRR